MAISKKRQEQIVLEKLEGKPQKIWTCKIGWASDLPPGSDFPMRQAVKAMFHQLTGTYPDFIFSGWGGKLDEIEEQVVDMRAVREERQK